MTRQQIVAAAIALLAAGGVDGYELDDLKKLTSLPPNYAEVHLSRTTPGPTRAGVSNAHGWRLQVRVMASTMSNANTFLDRVHTALYGKRIGDSTRLTAGPGAVPDDDDGRYSALTEFTFTL